MKNKPPYPIDSVDRALYLAVLLQQEGPLRITDAADRLGVSASTAHRLLAMLVYRGFAERCDDRRYRAGDVLLPATASQAEIDLLRRTADPHLRALMEAVQESTNLMVRAGKEMRFITTVECRQTLRVGDRAGRSLPAHLVSGGKAILATVPPKELADLYRDDDSVDLQRLRRQLSTVRRRGFAINDRQTEAGLTAIGMAIHDDSNSAHAAISVALPTARFDRNSLQRWVKVMSSTVATIERDLSTHPRP